MRRGYRGSGVDRNRTPRAAVCEVPPAPREQLGPGAARSDSKGSGPARLQPEGRANPGSRTDGTGALHLRREEACPRWQFCFPGKSRIRSPGHPARLEEVSLLVKKQSFELIGELGKLKEVSLFFRVYDFTSAVRALAVLSWLSVQKDSHGVQYLPTYLLL